MLGIGQDLVVHHAKASVLAGSTLPRLQHLEVHLLLVLDGGKLGPLVGLDQLFQRVARQRHVGRIGIHFQVLKVSPIQKGVDAMVIEFQHA